MEETERIRGKDRYKVFRQFQRDKTVIRLHLLGKKYDRLTVVTGIRKENGLSYLRLDQPRGFKKAVSGLGAWRLHFECTGKDRLHYVFRTRGGELSRGEVHVPFPNFIRRAQRRRSFRLEAPSGTKIFFNLYGNPCEANVLDISLGGALVSLEKRIKKLLVSEIGKSLKQVVVRFPSREEEDLTVSVGETIVKRWQKDPLTGQYRYGLQFVQMDKEAKEKLTGLIYQFQRGLLRKRQRLEI